MPEPEWRGLLVVDKPTGMSSHDVVMRVRRKLGGLRSGHLGTLDPFASGVLPVLLGRATRLAPYYSGLTKSYDGTVRLGVSTDTLDGTGEVVEEAPWDQVDEHMVETACRNLLGTRDQLPPMFSAKKVAGRRLYELARRGESVERPPQEVTVHELELLDLDRQEGRLRIRTRVSAGTYVRVLAEELGRQCGTVAHLESLRRTAVGPFTLREAVGLSESGTREELRAGLLPARVLLDHLPVVTLSPEEIDLVRHGRILTVAADVSQEGPVRLLDPDGRLVAVGVADREAGSLAPKVVLEPA